VRAAGAHFPCFTGTKVQILTYEPTHLSGATPPLAPKFEAQKKMGEKIGPRRQAKKKCQATASLAPSFWGT
jgi:hypothetical protein